MPRRGRPKLKNSELRKMRGFRATDEQWETIQEAAAEARVSASDFVLEAALARAEGSVAQEAVAEGALGGGLVGGDQAVDPAEASAGPD